MITRFLFSALAFCSVSLAQSQVELSGTVTDRATSRPVSEAAVRLQGLTLNTSTGVDGSFALVGPLSVDPPLSERGRIQWDGLEFVQESEGPLRIRILDVRGVQKAQVFAGTLPAGRWSIAPVNLPAGVYFYAFDTPFSHRRVRFLAALGAPPSTPGTSPIRLQAAPGAIAGRSAEATDTLLVTKTGYHPGRLPVDSYRQSGLRIALEDSSRGISESSTIVPDPSWPCYMPDGIPPPSLGTPVFKIVLQIGAIHKVGLTKFGDRRQYDIKGGSLSGDRISATVLTGGLDYDLKLSNGSSEIEQIDILRAGSTPILMRNAGVAPAGEARARMVLDFEAPNSSSFAWLNTGKFAAERVVDTVAGTITMEVHEISNVQAPASKVRITDPAGVVNQTWECVKLSGVQGDSVFTENVSLGTSISIGASKRGSRNIIPITGGTTRGKVVGKVLDGGADYQLSGLDARYTLKTDDGEYIIIRNCGSGGLVPVFEARVDGPYNYLNENRYLSSPPGLGGNGVSITFFEIK